MQTPIIHQGCAPCYGDFLSIDLFTSKIRSYNPLSNLLDHALITKGALVI